jgi:hypothetical protein
MRYTLIIFISTLAFWSCSGKILPSKTVKNEPPVTEYSEDLSIFRSKYESGEKATAKDNSKTTNIDTKKNKDATIVGSQNTEVEKVLETIKEYNKKNNEGRGYRIQVFAGNSKTEFETAKSFLLRNYSQLEIYESYSQPTYKIKTGDFLTYTDAEEYSKLLKSRFGTVRIISDKINLKKAINSK